MTIYGKWDFRNKPGGFVFDEISGKRPAYIWYAKQTSKGALLNEGNGTNSYISLHHPDWNDIKPYEIIKPNKPYSIQITYEPTILKDTPSWIFSTPNINSNGMNGVYIEIQGTNLYYSEIGYRIGIRELVEIPNAVEINKPNILTLYDPGVAGEEIILKNNNLKIKQIRKTNLTYVGPTNNAGNQSADISLGFKNFGALPFHGYIADFMISDEKPKFDQSLIVYENIAYSFNSEGMIIECGPVDSITSETFDTYGFSIQDMPMGKWNKDKFSIITKKEG